MIVCEEMQKLRQYLDAHEIKWEDDSDDPSFDVGEFDLWICRTHFKLSGHEVSVINGSGTWGGFRLSENNNQGLLEMMADKVNNGNPLGHLSAEECIRILKTTYKGLDILTDKSGNAAIDLMNLIAFEEK